MNKKTCILFIVMTVVILFFNITMFCQADSVIDIHMRKDDWANAIVNSTSPSNTNGYVIAGWTQNGNPIGTKKALIMALNSSGVPGASIIINSNSTDEAEATSMVNTSDDGYAVTGWTNYCHRGSKFDIFVIKLRDDNLGISWSKVYHIAGDNDYDHKAFSIIEVSDGGYALAGWYSPDGKSHHILVIRLEANGDVRWTKCYKKCKIDWNEGYSITEIKRPFAKFAVVGAVGAQSSSTLSSDAFVLALDDAGSPIIGGVFEDEADEQARSVIWDNFSEKPGVVVAGWTNSIGAGTPRYANVWVSKFGAVVNDCGEIEPKVIWSNVYYWPDRPEFDDKVLGDKSLILDGRGYALSGFTYSRGPNAGQIQKFLVIKLQYSGICDWASIYPVNTGDCTIPQVSKHSAEAYGMVRTNQLDPNYFAVVGWINFPRTLPKHILFTTMDMNGTAPGNSACKSCNLNDVMKNDGFKWVKKGFEEQKQTLRPEAIRAGRCIFKKEPLCSKK